MGAWCWIAGSTPERAQGPFCTDRENDSALFPSRVQQEIDELAGSLERPIESSRGPVEVLILNRSEEHSDAIAVNLLASFVRLEEYSHREFVRHFGVVPRHVALHVRRQFAGLRGKTVDHVVGAVAI